MSDMPKVKPLTSLTPAAMLMAVLDIIESKSMAEAVEAAGGINRPDGIRTLFWEARFKLAHATPDDGTWMGELDHAVIHALSAGTIEELQAALRVTAAVAASWALALEVRSQGDGS